MYGRLPEGKGERDPSERDAERLDVEVEPRRAFLDLARHEVLHRIEAHRARLQRPPGRRVQLLHAEGFEQPKHLNVVPPPRLQHARLHQPARVSASARRAADLRPALAEEVAAALVSWLVPHADLRRSARVRLLADNLVRALAG